MPWYKAGTATVTKGSPDVVGVGTTWGNGAITPGDSFSLVDSAGAAIAPFYEVLSVTDDTHIRSITPPRYQWLSGLGLRLPQRAAEAHRITKWLSGGLTQVRTRLLVYL